MNYRIKGLEKIVNDLHRVFYYFDWIKEKEKIIYSKFDNSVYNLPERSKYVIEKYYGLKSEAEDIYEIASKMKRRINQYKEGSEFLGISITRLRQLINNALRRLGAKSERDKYLAEYFTYRN